MAFTTKNITLAEMSTLVDQTHRSIVSSHRLLSRIRHPYYHSHPGIPPELVAFKKRITGLRERSLHLIIERYTGDSDPLGQVYSVKSFPLRFTGALALAGMGLGECGENAAKLAANMLIHGFGNITFLSLRFTKATEGMEQAHELILANISQAEMSALRALRVADFTQFMKVLPAHAVLGDAFLNVAFTPSAIPKLMQDYLAAYGGQAIICGVEHYTNCGPQFLKYYTDHAGSIKKELADIPEAEPRCYVLKGPWKEALLAPRTHLDSIEQGAVPK